MQLQALHARRYRSLREFDIEFGPLNLLIGPNAAGKSNVLDALRFLAAGLTEKDFRAPLYARGGALHLAWKGEEADQVQLTADFTESGKPCFRWSVSIEKNGVRERVERIAPGFPHEIMNAQHGKVELKGHPKRKLDLGSPTGCALAAAATDPDFAARGLAPFIASWAFFDLEPQQLRRSSQAAYGDGDELEPFGRNLAHRLYSLEHGSDKESQAFKHIVQNTRAILGLPDRIETRITGDEASYYFVQDEPGLEYPIRQPAVSSGTLRVLALMTALFDESRPGLVGIEEPENYVHPKALGDLAKLLCQASANVQVLITTHSPTLLNAVGDPGSVRVISREKGEGSQIQPTETPEQIRTALEKSGLGLGDYFDAQGFGA